MFRDRNHAGLLLAKKLEKYKNKNGIVLAVPRGGVPIGYIVAKELGLPLEIVLSKKIGHPRNPEFAIGSVSLNGAIVDNNVMDVSWEYLHDEANRILKSLKEKFKLYMGDKQASDLKGKTVIIVDDGIATGNTIRATIEGIRKNTPKEIIIAVPVAPASVLTKLSESADEIICLETPECFFGVGGFYEDFSQVSDAEVKQLLRMANEGRSVLKKRIEKT